MAMTPATPRPCQLYPDGWCAIHGTEWHDGYAAAETDAIVRAVNAHDALLAALRALAGHHDAYEPYCPELVKARALLRDLSPKEEGLEPDAGVLDVVGDA